MKDSIHKYFQVGIIPTMHYPVARYDLAETMKKIASDDYFDAIEIYDIADDETREKVRDYVKQSHLKVCYGGQQRLLKTKLNANDINEAGRRAAEETLIKGIDEAEYLGAKGIAYLSGKWSEETKAENYAALLKTSRNICDYAKTKGMIVELEVFDYDMDKASLIGPAPLAAQFAADMRMTHNNFGLMIDLSHIPTTYETSRFVIQTLRPYITHLHFGNAVIKKGCDGYGDQHPPFGYENSANDTAELLDYLRVLKEEGFFRANDPMVLSMEVQPRPHQDGNIILANTKRVLNRAWALLED